MAILRELYFISAEAAMLLEMASVRSCHKNRNSELNICVETYHDIKEYCVICTCFLEP